VVYIDIYRNLGPIDPTKLVDLGSSLVDFVCRYSIWFFFMFSNSYQLDLHNETCVALANLR
jgi:hypothetical protein